MIRRFDHIMGLNARNEHIARENAPEAIRLVDDKCRTKEVLAAAGAPVPPTLALVASHREVRDLQPADLPASWALKPNQSLGGAGILLAASRAPDGWRTASGRRLPLMEVRNHLRWILDGEFSPRGRDCGLLEPLLRSDERLGRLAFQGLPDVRVICRGSEPLLAMARLPTAASGGRANLHQHAIGAAVDLDSGRITRAATGRTPLRDHPDTGTPLVGALIPCWDAILGAASRCSAATGLRYLGADIVVDAERGPLILEVNARPGLQIQNVTGTGLNATLEPAAA